MANIEQDSRPTTPPPAPMLAPKDLTPAREVPPSVIQSITADTDLSSLTPQQINELTTNMLNEAVSSRPLLDRLAPISVLQDEYKSTSFIKQIDYLLNQGYGGIMRARGDGDCFYRSLAFAFIENIMKSSDQLLAAGSALSVLESSQKLLEDAGFQQMVYEDWYDYLVGLIQNITQQGGLNPEILLQAFQKDEISNSIVMYLRLLASAQIRADPSTYEPFLVHPDLNIPLGVQDFCIQFVESAGKEADHVQAAALSRALNINVQVAYLDGRNENGHVDFVPFANNEDHETTKDVLLLYRPGHYDVLERSSDKS